MIDLHDIPDLELVWRERAERVRRSRARTSATGMTRPPRDPDERAFLAERGQLGPFEEAPAGRSHVQSVRREAEPE